MSTFHVKVCWLRFHEDSKCQMIAAFYQLSFLDSKDKEKTYAYSHKNIESFTTCHNIYNIAGEQTAVLFAAIFFAA